MIVNSLCDAAGFPEMRGTASASSDVHSSSSDSDSTSRVSFEVVRLMLEVSNHLSCLLGCYVRVACCALAYIYTSSTLAAARSCPSTYTPTKMSAVMYNIFP
jgi:hypothetical protein